MREYKRNCPTCNKEISYSSNVKLNRAMNNNTNCFSCAKKGKNNPMFGLYGNNHPSFGKKLPSISGENSPTKRPEVRKKISETKIGNKNPMFGKTGNKHHRFGIKLTEQEKQKISKTTKNALSSEEIRDKIRRATIESQFGICYNEWLEKQTEYQKYENKVWLVTKLQPIHTLKDYKKRGRLDLNKNAYYLDHRVSIFDGFKNNIPAEIVGNIKNLKFIPARKNCKKGYKSDKKLLEMLIKEINR